MTRREAIAILRELPEDAEVDGAEVAEIFLAMYGRRPDADERRDALSHCYAAMPRRA